MSEILYYPPSEENPVLSALDQTLPLFGLESITKAPNGTKKVNHRELLDELERQTSDDKLQGLIQLKLNQGSNRGDKIIELSDSRQELYSGLVHLRSGQERRDLEERINQGEILFPPAKIITMDIIAPSSLMNMVEMIRQHLMPDKIVDFFDSIEAKQSPGRKTMKEVLTEVKPLMKKLNKPKTIYIVEDDLVMIKEMQTILSNWKELNIQVCPLEVMNDPSSCPTADVYLLDEDLSTKTKLKGQNYWNSLSYIFEDAKFLSITGGNTPNWANQNNHPHFEHKAGIMYGDNAKKFVQILNELL